MILHLFTQVSDYSIEFLKLLVKYYDTTNHTIVFRSKTKEQEAIAVYPEPIFFLASRKEILKELPSLLNKADRIIFHSFPVSRSLFFWIRYKPIMQKSVWSVWGQDAYWYKYCKKGPGNFIYEFIRRRLINDLDAVLCPVYNDYQYIVNHYKTKARYIKGMYPIPTDFEALRLSRKSAGHSNSIHIQVGNSANPTNRTVEILQLLSGYPQNNFKIFCPVSYGDPLYAKVVIDTGKRLFGDRFTALTEFLNRKEYAEFIASIDILIMNHQRQQGLGNIFSYLYLGKKVYIRSDNSSYSFFEQNGIQVYDTSQLNPSLNQHELLEMDQSISERNMLKTEELTDLDTIQTGWAQILK